MFGYGAGGVGGTGGGRAILIVDSAENSLLNHVLKPIFLLPLLNCLKIEPLSPLTKKATGTLNFHLDSMREDG